MAYRKKTLRKMPTMTKKIAGIISSAESIKRQLKNLLPEIEEMERDRDLAKRLREQFKSEPI